MHTTFKSRILMSTVITSMAFGATTAANAQIVDPNQNEDEIVVTGSRIAKQDFISTSPVASVDSAQFDITGTINTESLLNTLPQAVPGLDRTSNNPGGGIATIDLRGLGTNRTLVLVDGRRIVPSTGGGTVDINNIPTALIERVEVLTGGASAVYGSDAVAGVVNFVLKDDFEGAELSTGYEISEKGDAELLSINATIGGNFADGRGNAVFSAGYTDRKDVFQGDRDFSTFALRDGADGLIPGGSSGIPEGRVSGVFPDGSAALFNPDGTIRPFTSDDQYNYAPVNYLQLPQERFQLNGKTDFDVTDRLTVYADGLFSYNNVPQQLAPTPIFEPRGGTLQASLDGNPFIAPEAQQIISDQLGSGVDTDGDGIDDEFTAGAFGFRRRLLEVGPRIADNQFTTFQVGTGLEYEISDNFTFDLNFSEGRTNGTENQSGNINVDRFNQALLLADADGDGNVDVDADGNPTCRNPAASGGLSACAPINIYGAGNISQEAADFISTLAVIDLRYRQTNLTSNIAGTTEGFFELPGGPVGIAIGGEYRQEEFAFRPSQDVAAGTISGFNGAPPVSGEFDVYGAYGELFLPILADKKYAESLTLELAARIEDYSTSGTAESFKVAGEYAPDDQIRFRASFNTAVRAPSISELFQPQGENFPGATDPCSGSNGALAGDSALQALCQATGVPAANLGSNIINLPSGQVRNLTGGNPNLFEESAETLTVGFVASPEFIEGLTLAVDYFDITIDDVISAFGGGANNVIQTCYGDPVSGGVGSAFCNAITRGQDGLITQVATTSQNVAELTLSGIDVNAEYSREIGDLGLFGINYLATFTEDNTLVPFAGGTPITCAGEFGNTCGEPIPTYKHRMSLGWGKNNLRGQILWRYVGGTSDDAQASFVNELDAANYFDISGGWDITDRYGITFGVDNVFDREPQLLGDNQEQANTYPATYDVFGRTYFARATARF